MLLVSGLPYPLHLETILSHHSERRYISECLKQIDKKFIFCSIMETYWGSCYQLEETL
jgi:hypothetical protein